MDTGMGGVADASAAASSQAPSASLEGSSMQYNAQVRQLIFQIGQLAQAVPAAQQEFEMAAKALTAASIKLISAQPGPEQGMMPLGA